VTPRTLNRLKLLGIGAIAIAPVLGSYLLYWFWAPDRFTNYGTLIEPKRAPAAVLQAVSGDAFTFDQLRGRWIFVTLDSGTCAAGCEQKLWKMRQVRLAQGKDVTRIERVFLLEDGHEPSEHLRSEYAGTWFVRAKDGKLPDFLPAPRSARDHIYLIDPLGNLMLRFPEDADPKRMIKDMTRLLKYSGTG
jgi:cytochrome oxidase Cu insertion factor (SCO1/SenC/PrrC family)